MALAPLFALALLAADPQSAAPASVTAAAPAKPVKPAKAMTGSELAEAEPLPPGAPSDDYGFVAWCRGALGGHLDLFKMVQGDLNALPDPDPKVTAAADAEMVQAGKQYLAFYDQALDTAEKASPENLSPRRVAAEKTGRSIWDAAAKAETKTRMWSWVMWVLPGRCEYASERLYEKSMLKGQALGVNMRTAPVVKPPKAPERDALGQIIPNTGN